MSRLNWRGGLRHVGYDNEGAVLVGAKGIESVRGLDKARNRDKAVFR